MKTSLTNLINAIKSLKIALDTPVDELVRDATIQRFEFCVELSWKTARKVMGTPISAPKQVIREMAQNGYISDVEIWLEAVDRSNLSSHTYNEDLAIETYNFIKSFYPYLESLLEKLQ